MYKWKFILNSDVVKDIETIIKLNQIKICFLRLNNILRMNSKC